MTILNKYISCAFRSHSVILRHIAISLVSEVKNLLPNSKTHCPIFRQSIYDYITVYGILALEKYYQPGNPEALGLSACRVLGMQSPLNQIA